MKEVIVFLIELNDLDSISSDESVAPLLKNASNTQQSAPTTLVDILMADGNISKEEVERLADLPYHKGPNAITAAIKSGNVKPVSG